MTTTDVSAREPDELTAQAAVLLDRAALLAWEHAETADADSPLHDLGLGVYLARGAAAQLLTAQYQVDELEDIDEPEHFDERSVLELLTDADSLIGSRIDLIFNGLAVELCDLIRDAQALGC